MTKAELVKALQEAMEISTAQAERCVNALGSILAAELLAGGEVPLPRIGKLAVKTTQERTGRNPRTGETIAIPAGKKVVLKVGSELKDALK